MFTTLKGWFSRKPKSKVSAAIAVRDPECRYSILLGAAYVNIFVYKGFYTQHAVHCGHDALPDWIVEGIKMLDVLGVNNEAYLEDGAAVKSDVTVVLSDGSYRHRYYFFKADYPADGTEVPPSFLLRVE